jgi:hypothetical protein
MPIVIAGDSHGWITLITNGLNGGQQSQSVTFSGHTAAPGKGGNKS